MRTDSLTTDEKRKIFINYIEGKIPHLPDSLVWFNPVRDKMSREAVILRYKQIMETEDKFKDPANVRKMNYTISTFY
jgi:hypothetical protein